MKYICIEREYGSGGTQIAREVAKRCGVPCYGREILEAVAQSQNLSVSQIDNYEESVSNSFLYSVFVLSKAQSGDPDLLTKDGHIFIAEQQEIKRMASSGPAVFIGHCAAEALKNKAGVLRVFIRGKDEDKTKRIIEEYGVSEPSVKTTMQRFDRKRSNYYFANTTKKWLDPDNYDIVLNSSELGISGCADVLEFMLRHDFEHIGDKK